MIPTGPLLKLAGKVAARDFTRAVFLGLLDRDPDQSGADAYRQLLENGGNLSDAIKCVVSSTEFGERFMRQRSGDLLLAIFRGLLHRDPTPEELNATMASPADMEVLLRTISTSEEHWITQLQRNSAMLADEIARKLQDRVKDDEVGPPMSVRGSAVDHIAERLTAVIESEEYSAVLFRRYGASAVNEIYLALLNRAADPRGCAHYTAELAGPCEIGAVVKDIADSEEHWQRLLHGHGEELASVAYRSLLQRAPTPDDLAIHGDRDLGTVLEGLAQSDELWRLLLRRRAPALETGIAGLIAGIYAACSLPARSAAELDSLAANLGSPGDLQSLVATLLAEATEAKRNFAAKASLVVNVSDLPPVSFLAHWQTKVPSLSFADGFYPTEDGFAWSAAKSSLLVTKRTKVVLGCNYLRPGDCRRVTIESDGLRRTVTLDDASGCCRIEIGADRPQLIHFRGDGEVVPEAEGRGEDTRSLSFQLWVSDPETLYVDNFWETDLRDRSPLIYCVFDSKKEEDTLSPIHDQFAMRDYHSALLSAPGAIEEFKSSGHSEGVFLVASFKGYNKLFNAGCRGRFIYAEHGASPLKAYTYGTHYRRYDLILLPGPMWVERLSLLYPELATRAHAVGYAKLKDSRTLSTDERTAMCGRLGLDPARKIVLFAPTWSGGDRGCGIFNLKHLARSDSLLTIPHDGDWEFAPAFKDAGYLIHTPATGESISDYYPLADVLVSDISSTAVEFATLGKPVLCIATENIPDFNMKFRTANGRLQIPHTGEHWDFCPTVPAEQLNRALDDMLNARPRRGVRRHHSQTSKSATARVASMICAHGATAADLAVDTILTYLNVPPNRIGQTLR